MTTAKATNYDTLYPNFFVFAIRIALVCIVANNWMHKIIRCRREKTNHTVKNLNPFPTMFIVDRKQMLCCWCRGWNYFAFCQAQIKDKHDKYYRAEWTWTFWTLIEVATPRYGFGQSEIEKVRDSGSHMHVIWVSDSFEGVFGLVQPPSGRIFGPFNNGGRNMDSP